MARTDNPVHGQPRLDDGPVPLTDAERMLAERVARRLCLELRGLVDLLPEPERGASAMARSLKVDRNICQRIVAGAGRGDPGAETLVQLPGVVGLRQFLEAMTARFGGTHRELLASAAAAVEHYDRLIDHLAGSQRKLRERIQADVSLGDGVTYGPSDNLELRRSLFQIAAQVTGRWSQTWLSTSIVRPVPGDPGMTEVLKLRGHIGHLSRVGALPLEIGEHASERLSSGKEGGKDAAFEPLDRAEDPAQAFLLAPFCTRPLPHVTSRAMGRKMIHVIEGGPSPGNEAVDIVVADKRAKPDVHPARRTPALGEVWTLITFPARRLVFDVYLHRDLANACSPSLETHLWGPHMGEQGLWRWSTRFPGGPKLDVIGPEERRGVADAYARHEELTTYALLHAGWDPAEFVCYRADVLFPLWRAGYCMLFDFSQRG